MSDTVQKPDINPPGWGPKKEPVLLTVDEVAEYLGMSRRAVREEARSGRLKCWIISRTWRFRKSWVDEWLEKGPQVAVDFSARKRTKKGGRRGSK